MNVLNYYYFDPLWNLILNYLLEKCPNIENAVYICALSVMPYDVTMIWHHTHTYTHACVCVYRYIEI